MLRALRKLVTYLGTGVAIVAVLFFIGVFWPLAAPEPVERAPRLLIANVTIVDLNAATAHPHRQILIEDGVITAVGSGLDAGGAVVVDMRGRYAIPGLFDMHAHSIKMSPALTHPLYVAAGVTAVRDMGGCVGIEDAWVACADEKRAWNDAVDRGEMVGPRYDQVTSLAINGGPEIPDPLDRALGAATPEGARERASFDAARGIDFLKPYTMLTRDSYLALAAAAAENGMYLAGHQPLAVSGLDAVAAGQRSVEHAFMFIWDCYPGMPTLRTSGDPRSVYTNELRARMIAQHDPALCGDLHAAMVEAGTAYVPTHTTRKLDAYATDEAFRGDRRLVYIPGPLRALWIEDAEAMAERAGEGGAKSYRAFYEFGIEQTGVAHRAGVTILAGTDAPDSFVFPGTGLHDELEHLVMAGLSPADALRAATTDAARFLGLESEAGVIAPGARADIVFLYDDPLTDINAVRNVDGVVLAGSYYSRDHLLAMLRDVEEAAGSWTMWPKFIWQFLRSPIMLRQFAD